MRALRILRALALLFAALPALIGSARASAAEAEPAEGIERERFDVGAIPVLLYDTDVGAGLGITGAVYWRAPGWKPYQYAATAYVVFTTKGQQQYYFTFDAPRFLGSEYRPRLAGGFLVDKYRQYFGIGNASPILPKGDPRWGARYHEYRFEQIEVVPSLERTIGGSWKVNVSYALRFDESVPYEGAQLGEQKPLGWEGSRLGGLELEVGYDTRDSEASPTRGVFAVAGVRAYHAFLGSERDYVGATAMARAFHSFFEKPWLVLGGRVGADAMSGDVPFEALSSFGTREYMDGMGGVFSLRGVPRFRYVGEVKALANFEARSRVLRMHFFERPLDLWLVGFVDAGRVWSRTGFDGPPLHVHFAGGGGARLAWVEDFVLRLDYGVSQGSEGVYLHFGQLF